MPLSNVSVSDTFFTWLIRTNQLIVDRNTLYEGNTITGGTFTIGGFSGQTSLNVALGMIKGDGGQLTNVGTTSLVASTIRIAPGIANQLTTNGAAGLTITLGQTALLNVVTSNSVSDISQTNIASAFAVNTAYGVAVAGRGLANTLNTTLSTIYNGVTLKVNTVVSNVSTISDNTYPILNFNQTSATTNNKFFRIGYAAGQINFEKMDDAYTTVISTPAWITSAGVFVINGFTAAGLAANTVSAWATANVATNTAQSAFASANTTYTLSAAAFTQANSSWTLAQSAFTQANTGRTNSNTAYTTAAAAYGQANTGSNTANSALSIATFANNRLTQVYATNGTDKYLYPTWLELQTGASEPAINFLNANLVDTNNNRFFFVFDNNGELRGEFRDATAGIVGNELLKLNKAGAFVINGKGQGYLGTLTVFGGLGGGTYGPYGYLTNANPPQGYGANFTGGISIYATDRMVAGEFNAISDGRLKNNIVDLDEQTAIDIIKAIKPRTFTWKGSDKLNIGLIAQEVIEAGAYTAIKGTPNSNSAFLIETTENGVTSPANTELSVNYNELSVYALSTIKYLLNKVEELEKEINTLKAIK